MMTTHNTDKESAAIAAKEHMAKMPAWSGN